MQAYRKQHTPEVRLMLRMVQIVSTFGVFFGVVTLAKDTAPNAEWRHLLYIAWFSIAIISAEAILHWIKAGVHALLWMTLVVTFTDFTQGVANIGGATLGILVVIILVGYLYPLRAQFD